MDFSTLNTNESDALVKEYKSDILTQFHSKMTELFYNKINDITDNTIMIKNYYSGNNNLDYINQVMQDNIALLKGNIKKRHALNILINDLNFSKNSAYNIINSNFEHLDMLSNNLIVLSNIEETVYYVLDYINNDKNHIAGEATLFLEELVKNVVNLKFVLKNNIYEINNMQNYGLTIINTVKVITNSLLNAPNDLEDDEAE